MFTVRRKTCSPILLKSRLSSDAHSKDCSSWNGSELRLRCRFRLSFAMVKIQGTQYMRSHISARPATTKYFSNSFVFKTKIEKEGLPRDDTPALGAGGPRFKSGRPDQNISPVFFSLLKALFTRHSPVEFPQTGGLDSQVV
jgi:hypothetical protein